MSTIGADDIASVFSATPPLEAQKLLFSMAVTEGIGYNKGEREKGLKLGFVDIKRAYFYAPVQRPVYIEIPKEDQMPGDEDYRRTRFQLVWYPRRRSELDPRIHEYIPVNIICRDEHVSAKVIEELHNKRCIVKSCVQGAAN